MSTVPLSSLPWWGPEGDRSPFGPGFPHITCRQVVPLQKSPRWPPGCVGSQDHVSSPTENWPPALGPQPVFGYRWP